MTIRVPIIVCDGHDVLLYDSMGEMQRHLEPWTLDHSVSLAFDADGCRLRLAVENGVVTAAMDPEAPPGAPDLEAALRRYLAAMRDRRAEDPAMGLGELIDIVRPYARG